MDESHAEAEKRYTDWVEIMTYIKEEHQKMADHITKLTDAYDAQQNSFRALADAYISLEKDLTELMR